MYDADVRHLLLDELVVDAFWSWNEQLYTALARRSLNNEIDLVDGVIGRDTE